MLEIVSVNAVTVSAIVRNTPAIRVTTSMQFKTHHAGLAKVFSRG
jgi:hypothetical protein